MRHGYFLPLQNRLCGDLAFAAEAREIYVSLGFSTGCDHNNCTKGEACEGRYYKFAGRYDGVSIYEKPDGSVTKRIILQNFFSDELKVQTKDLP